MFFLIRMVFWLCVVALLLPAGQEQRPAQVPQQLDPIQALLAAGAVVSDMRHFCSRQPEACTVGTQAAAAVGEQAQSGAKMVYDLLIEKAAPELTGTIASPKPSQGTLTPVDRMPTWRGPPSREQHARRPT